MENNKKKYALRGTFFGIILKIIQIFFPFIIRTVFIRFLGVQYLGLNSLFSAILRVLNLAELGVSSALVFSMYRPIVEGNTEKICQILNLYRRYYRYIGLIALALGCAIMPVLPKLIKGTIPEDINVYVLYLMHLTSTVLSYWLFAYRNSLFLAHQRNDIVSIIGIVVNTIIYIIQAVSIIIFRNYYLYLSLSIVGQILIDLITALLSKRKYPHFIPKGDLPLDEKREIKSKVKDLFTAKVGSVINHSFDSIVISAFIGLEVLAIYQNYYFIISAIMAMFSIFFSACTAGIGHSLIVNSSEKNRSLLYNINHIVFMTVNFSCACFVSMCQPFMRLWVRDELVLNFEYVLLFALYLFAEEAPRTLIVFKDAGGIWKHDRFRPLISACVNLSLNLILTPRIGLYGIIVSTIISLLFISLPWVIVNINKRLFEINITLYIRRFMSYLITISISVIFSYCINQFIHFSNPWLSLVCYFFVSFILSNIIFFLSFSNVPEQKYVVQNILLYLRVKKEK